MITFDIRFSWPDYLQFSGKTEANTVEEAVRNLLFRGLGKTRSKPHIALKAKKILEAGAFEDLNDIPKVPKMKPIDKPLPPMDDDGNATDGIMACLASIREALAGNQTVQEIGEDFGLPVDRELAIPYNQGKAKPDGDDRHPHFFKDTHELQDPFQY